MKKIEKETIHIETLKELYKIAKKFTITLTTNIGIPLIYLKDEDFKAIEVYKADITDDELYEETIKTKEENKND